MNYNEVSKMIKECMNGLHIVKIDNKVANSFFMLNTPTLTSGGRPQDHPVYTKILVSDDVHKRYVNDIEEFRKDHGSSQKVMIVNYISDIATVSDEYLSYDESGIHISTEYLYTIVDYGDVHDCLNKINIPHQMRGKMLSEYKRFDIANKKDTISIYRGNVSEMAFVKDVNNTRYLTIVAIPSNIKVSIIGHDNFQDMKTFPGWIRTSDGKSHNISDVNKELGIVTEDVRILVDYMSFRHHRSTDALSFNKIWLGHMINYYKRVDPDKYHELCKDEQTEIEEAVIEETEVMKPKNIFNIQKCTISTLKTVAGYLNGIINKLEEKDEK